MNVKKYLDYVNIVSKCDDFSVKDLVLNEELPLQGRALMGAISLPEKAQLKLSIWCSRKACERSKNVRIDRRAYAAIEARERQLKLTEKTPMDQATIAAQMMRHWNETITALHEAAPSARNAVACSHWLCFTAQRKMTIGCVSHCCATYDDTENGYNAVINWILEEMK
jgi:hypothetical protein